MKRVLSLIIFISWSFLLIACSNNAVIETETLQDSVLSEPALEETTANEEFPLQTTEWQDKLEADIENEKGTLSLQETETGNTLILYGKQNQIIDTISVIEKTSIHQLTDNVFEIVQSVGSPAHYVFYYDVQNCRLSDVFFNPILISAGNEPKYAAYIENGELIIRDLFDEAAFYKKVTRDFAKTADPTSAIIGITLEEEGQFKIEYYQGEDYIQKTEIIDFTLEK